MNSIKTLSFTTLALLAAVGSADAYFRAAFKISKEYRQGVSGVPEFTTGDAYLYVVDGTLTITAGCALNGADFQFGASTLLGCNIGANGVVVDGIVDPPLPGVNSGTIDPAFFEIVGLEQAQFVEPGRPDLVRLNARPTLKFPLDAVNTVGGISTAVYYDLQTITGDVREYRLAGYGLSSNRFRPGYSFRRTYTSRSTMEEEIVEGVYQFAFPRFGQPQLTTFFNFPVKNSVEGYVTKPIRQGFRFLDVGPFAPDGFAQYDPRVSNTFRWEGLTANFVSFSDRLYLGFRRLANQTDPNGGFVYNTVIIDPTDPTDVGEEVYDFPPPGIDLDNFPGTRIRLLSPVQSSYTLPPGFFKDQNDLTKPNLRFSTMLELTLERDPNVGLGLVSERRFQLPIKFVNSFAGFLAVSFPTGTSADLMSKTADPDGDGISNWVEWLSGTNPVVANAPKTLSSMSFVPPSAAKAGEPATGYWQMSLDRPSALPTGADLTVEFSSDLKTWTVIPTSDPQWKVIDDPMEEQIRVISKTAEISGNRYFRVKYNDTTGS